MKQVQTRFLSVSFLFFFFGFTLFAAEPAGIPANGRRPKVALVLAGGSAYGLAHIGVIKVLEEMGIPVDIVVGASMGSIVGGLYAIGYDTAALERVAKETDWTELFLEDTATGNESFTESADRARYAAAVSVDRKGFSFNGGLIGGGKILRFVDALTVSVPTPVDFDRLPRRYRAVATDVSTGKRVVLAGGSIADAMRGSMSIPGVFAPYYLNGQYLVDGGLVDNLPIDLAREMGADIIIAVDLVNGKAYDPETDNRTPLAAITRSLDIFIRSTERSQLPHADLVIPVDIQGYLPTDFTKAQAFIDLGEATARSESANLEKILERTAGSPSATPVPKTATPGGMAATTPVPAITVVGADEKTRAKVSELFAPLIGTVPTADELNPLFRELDRSTDCGQVRVHRDSSVSGGPLVVILEKKKPAHNELRLNFLYETTFSGAITGNLNLVPSYVHRGLTTADSKLIVDAEVIDTPSLDARFIQPFGNRFSAEPFYAFRRDFITRLTSTSAGYQYQTISQTAGADIALEPSAGLRFDAGWSYDWIDTAQIPELPDSGGVDTASLLHARLSIRKLDSAIFPMNGFSSTTAFLVSLTELGSERAYRTLQTEGRLYAPLGGPVSAGILWIGGTDFSTGPNDDRTAPAFYKPELSNRRIFPGPLRIDEQIGSHVAGLGLELKYNLNWQSRSVQIPVYILLNAAAGAVIQNPRNVDWTTEVFHWNATVGMGVRLTDALGASVRGGLQRSADTTLTPFVALDLGAIGY